eukprot:m.90610 g.90610  ORF g.90610 m.90610 type:complete len:422 (-) comp13275_c0_seq2:103-1368(-)
MASSQTPLLCVALLLGCIFRGLPIYYKQTEWIGKRPEIVTPITSHYRTKECIGLVQQGVSPYDGSLCHTPPLFIAFLHTLDSFNEIHSDQVKAILLITLDLVASVFLYFFVCQEQLRRSRVSQPKKSTSAPDVVDNSSIPLLVAGFYLLNPMSVMTCIALSSSVVHNAAVIMGLYFGSKGRIIMATFWIALATYSSLYPVLLIFPVASYACEEQRFGSVSVFMSFMGWISLFMMASYYFEENWQWTRNLYETIILVHDLYPNIGLWWYLFTEMFENFNMFFLSLMHLEILILVAPTVQKFRKDPGAMIVVLLGIIAMFKTYPSISDFGLYLTFLFSETRLITYFQYGFLICCVFAATAVLFPIFWYTWMFNAGGNSNFFYAITLVYASAQIILLSDYIHAYSLHEYVTLKGFPKTTLSLDS